MAEPYTHAGEIREVLESGMAGERWWILEDLYKLVETRIALTGADWDPASSSDPSPRWQRNVRNVLQRDKQGPDARFDWDSATHRYRLRAVTWRAGASRSAAAPAAPRVPPPDRGDVASTFAPDDLLPLAANAIAELVPGTALATDPRRAAKAVVEACQEALDSRGYSDARENPRGRDLVHRETPGSPAVEQLATAMTEYLLTRFDAIPEQLSPQQRANAKGFALKRLGQFLNTAEALATPPAGAGDAAGAVETDMALDADALLRPRRRRIGLTFAQRRAVEQRAVDAVTSELTAEGWDVEDVGATHSYDLRCTKPGELHLYVEVKGTTGPLGAIQLTVNEVALARTHYPSTALYVVHGIELDPSGDPPVARVGTLHPIRPWSPDAARLRPTAFTYDLR